MLLLVLQFYFRCLWGLPHSFELAMLPLIHRYSFLICHIPHDSIKITSQGALCKSRRVETLCRHFYIDEGMDDIGGQLSIRIFVDKSTVRGIQSICSTTVEVIATQRRPTHSSSCTDEPRIDSGERDVMLLC